MKIIQIQLIRQSITEGIEPKFKMIGLSSDGELYEWLRKKSDQKQGWKIMKDEINFCECGNDKKIGCPTCKECLDDSIGSLELSKNL